MLARCTKEIGLPLCHYNAVDCIGPLVGVLFKERGQVIVQGIVRLHVERVKEFVGVLG